MASSGSASAPTTPTTTSGHYLSVNHGVSSTVVPGSSGASAETMSAQASISSLLSFSTGTVEQWRQCPLADRFAVVDSVLRNLHSGLVHKDAFYEVHLATFVLIERTHEVTVPERRLKVMHHHLHIYIYIYS